MVGGILFLPVGCTSGVIVRIVGRGPSRRSGVWRSGRAGRVLKGLPLGAAVVCILFVFAAPGAAFADTSSGNDATPNPPLLFASPADHPVDAPNAAKPSGTSGIAVGDVNRDGHADLVIAGGPSGDVSILLGDGRGGFGPPKTFPVEGSPANVVLADLNNDGRVDIAAAGSGDNNVSVLLGKGDGDFGGAISSPAQTPSVVAVGDLNRDGKLDLITGEGSAKGADPLKISVLLGRGDGHFAPPTNYAIANTYAGSGTILVADVNRDGKPDVVALDSSCGFDPGAVVVLAGDGLGGLGAPHPIERSPAEPDRCVVSAVLVDVNGDHIPDLVTVNAQFPIGNASPAGIRVHLGLGDGTFAAPVLYPAHSNPTDLAVADINADGVPDLIVANQASADVSVLLNDGRGRFQPPRDVPAGHGPRRIATLVANGKVDLVTANGDSTITLIANRTEVISSCNVPKTVRVVHHSFPSLLPAPADLCTSATHLLRNVLLAGGLGVAVAFPAELFDSTLSENRDEITRMSRSVRRFLSPGHRGEGSGVRGSLVRWLKPDSAGAFVMVTGASAFLYCLLDPHFGLAWSSVAEFGGMVVALLTVSLLLSLPNVAAMRLRHGEWGKLNAMPGTLIIAIGCVLLSRIANFQPGYLYGAIAGIAFVRNLEPGEREVTIAATAIWVLAVSVAAWLLRSPLRHAAERQGKLLPLAIDTALAGIFVAGIEATVIGLLPLRFLDGGHLRTWNTAVWAALFGTALFAFVEIVLDPGSGYVGHPAGGAVATASALFVAFGMASVAFWGFFRYWPPNLTPRAIGAADSTGGEPGSGAA